MQGPVRIVADLTTCEKHFATFVLISFPGLSGLTLWHYASLYVEYQDNPTVSITEHSFESGELTSFNITFFPQIALDLKETWNSGMRPACLMEGATGLGHPVESPPCIATLFATPSSVGGGYQGFFSGCESLPFLNRSSEAFHKLDIGHLEYHSNSTDGKIRGTSIPYVEYEFPYSHVVSKTHSKSVRRI